MTFDSNRTSFNDPYRVAAVRWPLLPCKRRHISDTHAWQVAACRRLFSAIQVHPRQMWRDRYHRITKFSSARPGVRVTGPSILFLFAARTILRGPSGPAPPAVRPEDLRGVCLGSM